MCILILIKMEMSFFEGCMVSVCNKSDLVFMEVKRDVWLVYLLWE